MSSKRPSVIMGVAYFAGALGMVGLGAVIIASGFEGYTWYRAHLGAILPVPTQELFAGSGGFISLLGLMLIGAGLVEIFYCPSCPFTFSRKWRSPTMQDATE